MTELFPSGWADYELIDSGSYEKLERYGRYIIRRPEPQAVWPKRLDEYFWQEKTHAWFRRSAISSDRESLERGEWILSPGMPDRWSVTYGYHGRQWSFRL
jgi:23S rRNA (cytosine1962-C5)-methyltransferase